jgi:hypothetical protein
MSENIEFETHIDSLEYLLGVSYIFIPSAIVKKAGGIKSGRWICEIGQISFQCGMVSLSEGNAYITINKSRMKKAGLKPGDHVHVKLKKDNSEFGMEMCEELRVLLEQDPEGRKRFEALKPGMQRYILYYVAQVKNPQLRIDRSVLLINNLKISSPGKETFRILLGKA